MDGARDVLDELYRAHHADIARFVRLRIGRRADAADVCQDVWAAVGRALSGGSGEAPTRAWIFGVARHKTIDVWRHDGGLETLDTQLREGGPLASLMGVRAPTTPSRVLSRKRRGATLRAALAELRPEDRELLELRFVHDLKPAEIAGVLDGEIDPNTIAQRVVRATRRLRAALLEAGLSG
jgi:RNA polymerase sigma-70 factor (ECF subfamily)